MIEIETKEKIKIGLVGTKIYPDMANKLGLKKNKENLLIKPGEYDTVMIAIPSIDTTDKTFVAKKYDDMYKVVTMSFNKGMYSSGEYSFDSISHENGIDWFVLIKD